MAKSTPVITFDENRLKQALQLNSEPLAVSTLMQAFGLRESDKPRIESILKALVSEGFAVCDKKNGKYKAMNPMSDLAVAKVGKIMPGRLIHLTLQGVGEDFPFRVTMPSKQIKGLTGRQAVREDDLIAVILARHGGGELKARYYAKFHDNKTPTLVGQFNRRSGTYAFNVLAGGIKTSFNTIGAPAHTKRSTAYIASIPEDLDPFAPQLVIGEQKWDPDTGTPIADIIARRHNIPIQHENPATHEAKKVIRGKFDVERRRDLTHERILVIDPKDAKDHDDGIMIQRTIDGFRTLVVIADVPHYVRPHSALDDAARERGFTHYFRDDKTIHMLPGRLVRHASLIEGKAKPVIYVEQYWDEAGNPTGEPEIGAGVIAAQKRMSYGQFQDLIDTRDGSVASYRELGDILVPKIRMEDRLMFDSEGDNTQESYSQLLVQAMMVEANVAIAEYLLDRDIPFLTRAHSGSNDLYKFEEVRDTLESWGYDVPDNIYDMNTGAMNRILREATLQDDRERVERFLRSNFLNRAHYSTIPFSHFGLNRDIYTHATSPIRRYGDILTLRAVHSSLGHLDLGLSERDADLLDHTAGRLNTLQELQHRVARDTDKYYAVRELHNMEGCIVTATLHKVGHCHVEILLPKKSGLSKQFSISSLPGVWRSSPHPKTLIHNNHQIVREGDKLRVRLANVRPHEADWDIDRLEVVPMAVKPSKTRTLPADTKPAPQPVSASIPALRVVGG